MTETQKYAFEASMYDQLACYYKYRNPQKYVQYYNKHYEAVQKLVQAYESGRVTPQQSIQQAKLRVLHAAPDASAVDMYINGQQILQNISYKQISNYLSIPQGQYRFDVYKTGTNTSPIYSSLIPVMNNKVYTITAVGDVSKFQLLSFIDNTFLPYGDAKIRFAHLSPDTSAVDVAFKNGDVLFANVSFKQFTEFLQVTPGTADIEVRLAGTKDIILTVPNMKIKPNIMYTIYAVGFASKPPKLETILYTN
ncbi:DUF4397 domain-containing protein [Ectobacillus polymachus]|uniref:DUF4397 domain-containing protein n=1 Tax=Ectobacillus polymachus TaxID=1508806 RepID=UPI003A86ACD3